MSCMKRFLEDTVEEIANASGYSFDFIMDIANEYNEEEGYIDFDNIRAISMEHDW